MYNQWDPKQYEKFGRERTEPFLDLCNLIHPMHHPRILDLGCGNGQLTKMIHEKLHAHYTIGIDTSKEMLAQAMPLQHAHLHFREEDIALFTSKEPFQLIMSNAALQWVPDHEAVLEKYTRLLSPGGQLAIQMPANQNYPTHVIAAELSSEPPFNKFIDQGRLFNVLTMEDYAQLLEKLGYESQVVRLQLYSHFLESTAAVIEWVKGSLLTYYKSRLDEEMYELFLKEYQSRLIERLGWSEPFFFPIKRMFLWGHLPSH